MERHRAVTTESLRAAVSKWLYTDDRAALRFHPEAVKAESDAKLDRSQSPALGADRPFHAPNVQTAKLDNGLTVFVVTRTDLPKVALRFVTRAGSADDPADRAGLADLAVQTMRRGTVSRQALQIEDTLGDLGTSISGSAAHEYSEYDCEILSRNGGPALDVIADIVRNPSFPPAETDREKKKQLDALAQAEDSATGIAQRLISEVAFGASHVYGRPVQGFRSSVEKITPEDLTRFHNTYWKAGSSALILAGDISLDHAMALAKQYFGSWNAGTAPVPDIQPPAPLGPGKVFLVNSPDAAQTVVAEILAGPTHQASEYYPFTLADAVWGGAAGARLGVNIREDKGYSYGVFSFPQLFTKYGLWVARGGVQTNKTKESVVEFQKELHFIAGEKPVTEKELAGAKEERIRGYAQRFESTSRVSSQIAELWALDMPMSELQREPDELQKASLASVNGAAEKYATPSRASLLLVGDLSKIEPGIRQLNIGEVVTLDAEGKLVTSEPPAK